MTHPSNSQRIRPTRLLDRFWTPANALSLLRFMLVPPIAYLIVVDGPLRWVFGLIVLGVVTDFFDGRVARWSHTVSEWGKVLDPLADKFAAALVVAALTVKGLLPVWLLGIILFRDVGIVVCATILAQRKGRIVMSSWVGRLAVSALAVTCLAALLHADPPVLRACVWTSAVLLVSSQILYLIRFFRLLRADDVELPEGKTTSV